MTRAREQVISLDTTPYYHCISRCVRRAYLCGEDSLTGKNYEHRKSWVVERLRTLAEVFAVDICAYAVMSNHYHVVLRVDQQKSAAWRTEQVVDRWQRLYGLPLLVQRYLADETTQAENVAATAIIETWRQRLTDISWFMRALNEHLARRGNAEDNCKGRFWEGRFKSQALLDEAAVLTCMSYVDLNPIRATLADTPEDSDFTSIQQRIRRYVVHLKDNEMSADSGITMVPLMPLVKQHRDLHKNAIGFTVREYLQLVDWAGRVVRDGKRGAISEAVPPILQRLGLEPAVYLEHIRGIVSTEQPTVMGHVTKIREAAEAFGRRFIKGVSAARRLYRLPATA